MKRLYMAIIIVLIAAAIVTAAIILDKDSVAVAPTVTTAVPTPAEATQIIFPAGKEHLIVGKPYTLQWTGGEDPTQIFLIDVSLKPIGASVSSVDRVYHVQNTGSYTYTIPSYIKAGTYQFEIGNATSDEFQIVTK